MSITTCLPFPQPARPEPAASTHAANLLLSDLLLAMVPLPLRGRSPAEVFRDLDVTDALAALPNTAVTLAARWLLDNDDGAPPPPPGHFSHRAPLVFHSHLDLLESVCTTTRVHTPDAI